MPFINGVQVSVGDGRVQMSLASVSGSDDFLGGLRYEQVTGAIRAAQSAGALGSPEFINAAVTPPAGGYAGGVQISMVYRMTIPGEVVAARFWRQTSPLLTRQLTLFDYNSQAVLGTTVATVEGAAFVGWVNANFPTPIPVTATQRLCIAYTEASTGGGTHGGTVSACPVVNAGHATYVEARYGGSPGGFPSTVQANMTYYADLSVRFAGAVAVANGLPTNANGQLAIDQGGVAAAYRNGLAFTSADAVLVGVGATPVVHVHGWPIAADGRLCVNLI